MGPHFYKIVKGKEAKKKGAFQTLISDFSDNPLKLKKSS